MLNFCLDESTPTLTLTVPSAATAAATAVSVKHADPTDSLSVNTFAGKNSVFVNGVAGLLQLLVDGAPV